jgi:hypothetical protein
MTRRLCFAVAVALMVGCGIPKDSGEAELTIRFNPAKDAVEIEEMDMFQSPIYLNLDNDQILLGKIDRILVNGDRIYLMNSQAQTVAVYDTSGNFINNIDRKGRGPKEYLQLWGMFIEKKSGNLCLNSRIDRKLLIFDKDGGEVLEQKQLPKAFSTITPTDSGCVGYMGNWGEDHEQPYNVWFMDDNFEIEDWSFPVPEGWESTGYANGSIFSSYGNNTYYIIPQDYNIYSLEKGDIKIPYKFDFGKYNWPEPDSSYDRTTEIMDQTLGMGSVHRLDYFQQTDNYLVIKFIFNGQSLLGIYNKKSGSSTICSPGVYTDKYFLGFGEIVGMDEHAIYTILESYMVKRIWNGKDEYNDFEAKYSEQIKRLRADFPNVKEDGNPFLVIYPFK